MDTIGLAERAFFLLHRKSDVRAALRRRLAGAPGQLDILDFGGGQGHVAASLAAGVAARFTIADVDRSALEHVPDAAAFQPLVIPPRPPYPFAAASFDRIILVDVLHHVPEGAQTLAALAPCLRPGGSLMIVEFDARRLITHLFGVLVRFSGRRCHFWTPSRLAQQLEHLGLRVQVSRLDALRFLVEGQWLAAGAGQGAAER